MMSMFRVYLKKLRVGFWCPWEVSWLLYEFILGGTYVMPPELPAPVKDLIQRMLVVDPLRRITIAEIKSASLYVPVRSNL